MTDAGADGTWQWVASGRGDYDRVDGVVRDRPIESGDLVFVDMGARVGGYWADFSRAAVIGDASDDQRRLQAEIVTITGIGVDALRPGRSLGDAAALIADAMDHAGLAFSANAGRFGHGLGMWATEPPDLVVGSEVAIESGMVLTVEPATVTHEGMFHCEQNVVVTDAGPRILSTAPVDLLEVG